MKMNKIPSLNQRHMGATDTWISRNCEKCNPYQVRLAVQYATCDGKRTGVAQPNLARISNLQEHHER
jgi:hypothetical protein